MLMIGYCRADVLGKNQGLDEIRQILIIYLL